MDAPLPHDRELVFSRIKKSLAPVVAAGARTELPQWDDDLAVCHSHPEFGTPWELFAYKLEQLHGHAIRGWDDLAAFLQKQGCRRGYCDPAYLEAFSGRGFELETSFDPNRVDDYEFGITRASAAIAETGTLVLKDGETTSRLGALAPWVHVAVVEPGRILPDVGSAIRAFGDDPYVVFATGPSKTADVEGILIEGVHGPGVQIACLV